MSDEKIVESVGRGKLHLANIFPQNYIKPSITKVRVVKKRDGVVYEDRTVEYKNGLDR